MDLLGIDLGMRNVLLSHTERVSILSFFMGKFHLALQAEQELVVGGLCLNLKL